MKKGIALFLAIFMCLSLCACKSDKVKHVEALIDAIGTVTADSKPAIDKALRAYYALTPKERDVVNNFDTLEASQMAYKELYTTIEITMENWEEFFELVPQNYWHENDFGEAIQCDLRLIFRAKEDYKDKIDYTTMSLIMEIGMSPVPRYYEIDWQQRTITILNKTGLNWSGLEDRTMTASYNGIGDSSLLCEFYMNHETKSSPNELNGKPYGFFYENIQMLRIQGSISVLTA